MKTKSDFICKVCNKYVPRKERKIVVRDIQYWNGFYDDTEKVTEIYHKKCYQKLKNN